jgi:curved DNA-binding protein CbpA
VDELRRAWGVLGLKPGGSVEELRSRYLTLAKQWHPDRFANDPQGQAEAGVRMRMINAAYRQLLDTVRVGEAPTHAEPTPGPRASYVPRGRLSREELDRIVSAIGTESAVDLFIDVFPSASPASARQRLPRAPRRWRLTPRLLVTSLAMLVGAVGLALLEQRLVDATMHATNSFSGFAILLIALVVIAVLTRRNP